MNEEVFEAVCVAAWRERSDQDYWMMYDHDRDEWEASVRAVLKVVGLSGGAA